MTNPQSGQGPNEFYVGLVQQQLDRRFGDLGRELDRRFNEMDRRFSTVDADIKDIKVKVDKLEDAPRDSFRIYIVPVLTAIVTAILISYLVKQGVVNK